MGLKVPLVPILASIVLVTMVAGMVYLLVQRDNGGDGGTPPTGDENRAPVANAGYDKVVGPGEGVELDGTSSSDPDGDTLSFSWDLDDSQDSDGDGDRTNDVDLQGAKVSHAYPSPVATTTYRAVLNVSDGKKSDTDTVTITILVSTDLEPPVVNMSCYYARSPIPGVAPQYVLSIDSVSRIESIMNYSYVLLGPDNAELRSGPLMDLLTATPNATMRYVDKNPRYADLSEGDSVTAKDVPSIPEGAVFEVYFKAEPDPSGAVTLTKGPGDRATPRA